MSSNEISGEHKCCPEAWQVGGVIAVILVLRLLMIGLSPVGLSHDEAYYWDWSRNLDWGYYSKPPMIAWLIAASTSIGGSIDFFVRLPAVLLSTAGLVAVYLLARSMYDQRVAWWALLLTAAMPGSVALGFLMTIDAPLMFAWTATLYGLWRATSGNSIKRGWLGFAAVTMGLGLLSKQTMLAIYPLTLIYLLANSGTRKFFLDWSLWAWGIGSFLFLTPVFWWNARHGWPTLQHTREHFQETSIGLLDRLKDGFEFWGTQFGVYSPVTFTLIAATLLVIAFRIRRLSRAETFLMCFSLLPLIGILLLSFRQRLEPNWPAPFYVSAIILTVVTVCQGKLTWPGFRDRRILHRAFAIGALFAVITMVTPALMQWSVLRGQQIDPLIRLHGWQQLAHEIESHREIGRDGQRTPILVTAGRAETAELAFYLPDQPEVSLWRHDAVIDSQYDLWARPYPTLDEPVLILAPPGQPLPAIFNVDASAKVSAEDIEIAIGNGRSLRFTLHRYTPRDWVDLDVRHVAREPQELDARPATSKSLR